MIPLKMLGVGSSNYTVSDLRKRDSHDPIATKNSGIPETEIPLIKVKLLIGRLDLYAIESQINVPYSYQNRSEGES